MEESYQVFRTVNPRYLDGETSYEYAQTFFLHGQYEEALNVYRQVPNGHPLFDLASYYGAIAAVKLKRYQEAEKMIDNAVVLPSKLIKSRNMYKKHIRDLRAQEQREHLNREKAAETKRLKDQTRVFTERLKDSTDDEPKEAPQPQPYQGYKSVKKGAFAGYRRRRVLSDFNRTREEDGSFGTNFFMFKTGFMRIFQKGVEEPQGSAGFQISGEVMDRSYRGTEFTLDRSPDEELLVASYAKGGNGNEKIADGGGSLWLERRLFREIWGGLELGYLQTYPDFKSGLSLANRSAKVFLGNRSGVLDSSGQLMYLQRVNHKGKVQLAQSREVVTLKWRLPQNQAVSFEIEADQFHYEEKGLNGADRRIRGVLGYTAGFPLSINAGLQAGGGATNNMILYDLPQILALGFSQQEVYARAFVSFEPVSWFGLMIDGAREQRTFSELNPASDENRVTLEENYPNFVSTSSVTASVNLLF